MNGKISLCQALSGLTLKVAIVVFSVVTMTVPTNSNPPSGFMTNIPLEDCNRGGFNLSFMQVNGFL